MQIRAATQVRHSRQPRPARRQVMIAAAALKVAVTGAGGRTGSLVVKKLAERSQEFETRAIVRNGGKSRSTVEGAGVKPENVFEADVSAGDAAAFAKAFDGADAVIIATSGVPVLKPLSLIKVFWAKLVTKEEGVRPDFEWRQGQTPEQVDWLGQKAQIDAAKAAGVKHVVVIGSMGGTQKDNMLNKLGDGNILMWKRKAEQYLIRSGLTYTIIHPGGLLDKPGGERELVVDVDDVLLERKVRSIPRADVAELCVQCLTIPAAKNRAFDVISLEPGAGTTTAGKPAFEALVSSLGKKTCDYSINSQESLTSARP